MDVRWLGRVGYADGLALQRDLHAAVLADEVPGTTLLLEHPPTYTAGRRTEPWERPADGTPVVDVDRGGKITWHGPGQLVGYPVLRLPPLPGSAREGLVDVVAHVRRVEELLIRVAAQWGVDGERVEGRSGVWVRRPARPDAKVAAVGIRVARGVTTHGFALNCDCDLAAFDRIVPCGISDAAVTSLTDLLGRRVGVEDVREAVAALAPLLLEPGAPGAAAPQPATATTVPAAEVA